MDPYTIWWFIPRLVAAFRNVSSTNQFVRFSLSSSNYSVGLRYRLRARFTLWTYWCKLSTLIERAISFHFVCTLFRIPQWSYKNVVMTPSLPVFITHLKCVILRTFDSLQHFSIVLPCFIPPLGCYIFVLRSLFCAHIVLHLCNIRVRLLFKMPVATLRIMYAEQAALMQRRFV
jgi:hypothetical protein